MFLLPPEQRTCHVWVGSHLCSQQSKKKSMSVVKSHSGLLEVFSHTRAFHLPSLLPVQVSLCFLYYLTSSSELPKRRLPYLLVFQFTLLFPHQSPNAVVSFSSPIPGSRPPSSTSPPIHRAAGLHDHMGLWDNGYTQQAVFVPRFSES